MAGDEQAVRYRVQTPTTGEVCGAALERIKTEFVGLCDAARLLPGTGQYGLFPIWVISPSRRNWKELEAGRQVFGIDQNGIRNASVGGR